MLEIRVVDKRFPTFFGHTEDCIEGDQAILDRMVLVENDAIGKRLLSLIERIGRFFSLETRSMDSDYNLTPMEMVFLIHACPVKFHKVMAG
jgi:hypothetical protein